MADRNDDPGVLGNLPRSRPGTRSAKRASGGAGAKKQPAPKRKTTTASKTARARPAKPRQSPSPQPRRTPPPRQAPPQPADPVTQAVRLAGKVAETGVKTAVGILKRLPGGR